MRLFLIATIVFSLSGCSLNVLESSTYDTATGEHNVKYMSNSLCGSSLIKEHGIGVFVAKYGGLTETGNLSVWAYNNNESDKLITLNSIGEYTIKSKSKTSSNVGAGERAELLEGKIHLGMYSSSHPIQVELSISNIRAQTTVKLEREEHSGYWGAATGACKPPSSFGGMANKS